MWVLRLMRRLFPFGSSRPADALLSGDGVGLMIAPAASSGDAASFVPAPEAAAPSAVEPPSTRSAALGLFRKLLLTLIGIGVIGSAIGGSMMTTHSAFTTTVVNPSNTFAAGTLKMTNSASSNCTRVAASACGALDSDFAGTANAYFQAATNSGCTPGCELAPGVPQAGKVEISNSGTLPATMSLSIRVDTTAGGCVAAGCTTNSITCTNNSGSTADCNTLHQYMNLTIYDNTIGWCIYPWGSSCPDLTNVTTGSSALTAFPGNCPHPSGTSSTCSLPKDLSTAQSLTPGASTTGGYWGSSSPHDYVVTVEVFTGFPQDAPAYFDMI